MTEASRDSAAGRAHRRVLFAVHTGRSDIVELARSSAARLAKAGITVRLLEDEADALGIEGAQVVPRTPRPPAARRS